MALNAYLRIEGDSQGLFHGGVSRGNEHNLMKVIGASHEVLSPRDQYGAPTGKRQHKHFIITKEVDQATPQLYQALVSDENISYWQLDVYTLSASGQEVGHYRVYLRDASVRAIRYEMLNNQYPANVQPEEREHVSFDYRRIERVWNDDATTMAEDQGERVCP